MSTLAVEMPRIQEAVQAALVADLGAGVVVAADLEENSVDELPMLLHGVTVGGDSANRLGVWPFTLTVTTLALTDSGAFKVARDVYRVLRSWRFTRDCAPFGGIRFNRVLALPTRVDGRSKVAIGKQVEQHSGSFELIFFESPYFN